MISMEQIDGEIAVLENEKPTHVIMEKLANLYIVRDHMVLSGANVPTPITTVVERTVGLDSGTEFAELVIKKDIYKVMPAIDELMDAVMVLNPRLYKSVIRKIEDL